MAKNKIIDFKWDLKEEIRKSEIRTREEYSDTLNRNLSGMPVKIQCLEHKGISIKNELVEHVCFVDRIVVNSEGYLVTIITDKGDKLIPHPPYGIEVLVNDKKDIHS